MKFTRFDSSLTNNTDDFLIVLGYNGSFIIKDPEGNQADSLFTAIPAGIVPPGYSLSGGTRGYGVFVKPGDLSLWM